MHMASLEGILGFRLSSTHVKGSETSYKRKDPRTNSHRNHFGLSKSPSLDEPKFTYSCVSMRNGIYSPKSTNMAAHETISLPLSQHQHLSSRSIGTMSNSNRKSAK